MFAEASSPARAKWTSMSEERERACVETYLILHQTPASLRPIQSCCQSFRAVKSSEDEQVVVEVEMG